VFPIGDFKFLWSDSVDDLFVATNKAVWYRFPEDSAATLPSHVMRDALKPEQGLYTDLIRMAATYKTDDMVSAVSSGSEIMIRAASYYGISMPMNGEVRKVIFNELHEIVFS